MSLKAELRRYLAWVEKQKNYSPSTVKQYGYGLALFLAFASARGANEPAEISRDLIAEWAEDLTWRVTRWEKKPIRTRTRFQQLSILKGFLHYLYEMDLTLRDLSHEVTFPKLPRRIPGVILEDREVGRMIRKTVTGTSAGIRDKAILEVLYSTGIRASELGKLRIEDVDHENGLVYVREGKGAKDRMTPIGKKACEAVRDWLVSARSDFLCGADPGTVFLHKRGGPMSKWTICKVVKQHAKGAEIEKRATTHTFRRTCATLLLRDGANIRAIQEMLGHESLNTTMVYLKVAAREIKQEHEKHHPREKATQEDAEEPEDTDAGQE